jgi:hypothetical protein
METSQHCYERCVVWELPHSLQLGPRQATHRNNESKRFHDARDNEADATMSLLHFHSNVTVTLHNNGFVAVTQH